jgi:ectoine hydroxylase-related dioxygenase (phytanoyl-CoA dioxygenase family)
MLTTEHIEQIIDKGYAHVQNMIPVASVMEVQRQLNQWRQRMIVRQPLPTDETAVAEDRLFRHAETSGVLSAIGEHVLRFTKILLGENNASELERQIVGWSPSSVTWKCRWHLDRVRSFLRSTDTKPFPGFEFVVCVPLTPTTDDRCGNLFVCPGAHWIIAQQLCESADMKHELKILVEQMDACSMPTRAQAIRAEPGDIILMHSLLPHGTSRNDSPTFADKVYFRYGASCPCQGVVRHASELLFSNWSNTFKDRIRRSGIRNDDGVGPNEEPKSRWI